MHVLVPFDPSPTSEAALEFALKEYSGDDVDLEVIYFNSHNEDTVNTLYEKQIKDLATEMDFDTSSLRFHIDIGNKDADNPREVGEMIIEYAEKEGVDKIIMGRQDKGLAESILKGSTSKKVVNNSSIPVTIVP